MKIISHIDSDMNPESLEGDEWVTNWFDNRAEPVVRCGGEVFQTHFEPEIGLGWEIFTVDPRRSMAGPLWKIVAGDEGDTCVDDFLFRFLTDIGLLRANTDMGLVVAFHTMMPRWLPARLKKSWMPTCCFMPRYPGVPRVINNPLFHNGNNPSEKRLLNIGQDDDCFYAVDLTVDIPPAKTLAHEIALVNHIQDGDAAVDVAEQELLRQMQEVLGT